jgi:hypothetical protein
MLLLSPLLGAPASSRTFTAGNFVLELNGSVAGTLKSVDGGNIRGEVVVQSPALVNKHIGGVRYEQFEIQTGLDMAPMFQDWIAGTLRRQAPRRDGAVIAGNFDFKAISRRTFTEALITEVGFPTLDSASKEPAYLTVKFAPGSIRQDQAAGEDLKSALGTKSKNWLSSNFAFKLDGLPTGRVSKIEAFTVKQGIASAPVGSERIAEIVPTAVELPNLKVTFSATDAEPWRHWFEDFVIKGNNGQDRERGGSIVFLGPNLRDELGSIDLLNVGIVSLSQDAAEAGADRVASVTVELYVEQMELKINLR